MLSFRSEIKQILWHPTIPNILGLMTNDRQPTIYMLYNFEYEPAKVELPFENITPSSRWEICWVKNAATARCPLLVSSNSQFSVGFLSLSKDLVVFEPLLCQELEDHVFEADESEFLDTPSKPARHGTFAVGLEMSHMDRNWTAPATQYAW